MNELKNFPTFFELRSTQLYKGGLAQYLKYYLYMNKMAKETNLGFWFPVEPGVFEPATILNVISVYTSFFTVTH